jgi:asparagine synthetase B (glutamine-hydrolysing)
VGSVRRVLLDKIANVQARDVAIALSGGVDSTVLALALLESGRRVTAFSFRLASRESGDWTRALETATRFGLRFVDVALPEDRETLERDIRSLVEFGLRKKTAIECVWPMLYLIRAVKESELSVLFTGSCADGHFGISRHAVLNHIETVETLDAYRKKLFGDPDYAQVESLRALGRSYGVDVYAPYRSAEMCGLFVGRSHEELNTPRQKAAIWSAYPEAETLGLYRSHRNLHLGDSGISEHFEQICASTGESVVAVYNRIARDVERKQKNLFEDL